VQSLRKERATATGRGQERAVARSWQTCGWRAAIDAYVGESREAMTWRVFRRWNVLWDASRMVARNTPLVHLI
jgi:hypothetical protein